MFTEKVASTTTAASASSSSISPVSSSPAQSSSVPAVPTSRKFLAPVSFIADVVPPDTPLYRQFLTRRTASHQSSLCHTALGSERRDRPHTSSRG